ncbi:hypothetical protein LCGC14_2028870 [marine sediment metagenome]|uniref:Uncharacterized protein n=1 Tax=marine sediment metagenome TaxID=412755 RepID=A0A0F9FHS8_9ZZZZ
MIERRLHTCCPEDDCSGFQDGLRLLYSHGIEPCIEMDDDDQHYLGFSIPDEWDIEQRRKFNDALTKNVATDRDPCQSCHNTMWSQAAWVNVEEERWFVCDECMALNKRMHEK